MIGLCFDILNAITHIVPSFGISRTNIVIAKINENGVQVSECVCVCVYVLSQICLKKVDSIQVLDVSNLLLYKFKETWMV